MDGQPPVQSDRSVSASDRSEADRRHVRVCVCADAARQFKLAIECAAGGRAVFCMYPCMMVLV
jgi:hypothetical protein